MYAAMYGQKEAMSLLLERGANIQAQDQVLRLQLFDCAYEIESTAYF
jgi:ankyrin repeat protein